MLLGGMMGEMFQKEESSSTDGGVMALRVTKKKTTVDQDLLCSLHCSCSWKIYTSKRVETLFSHLSIFQLVEELLQ